MKSDKERGYMAILAILILGATFYLGYVLLTKTIPSENRDIVNVALGLILWLSGTVVGYYFGSSKSSSDKNKITERLAERDYDRKKETGDNDGI